MSRVVVAAGSNIDPLQNLHRAARVMSERFHLLAEASPRATEPVGPPGQPLFWNAGYFFETDLDPVDLKAALQGIESEFGRVRTGNRYAPRPLDLDEIWRDGAVVDGDVHDRLYLREILTELGIDLSR